MKNLRFQVYIILAMMGTVMALPAIFPFMRGPDWKEFYAVHPVIVLLLALIVRE